MSSKNSSFPTSDELALLHDEDLDQRYSSLTGFISRERRRGNERADLEINHCYLFREIEIRKNRVEAHQKWLSEGGHLRNVDMTYESDNQIDENWDWVEY